MRASLPGVCGSHFRLFPSDAQAPPTPWRGPVTAPLPIPAPQTAPHMDETPYPQPAPSPQAAVPPRPSILARARISDSVVLGFLGFLGAIIVLLLGYALTTNNDKHAATSDRITGLEDTVNSRFAQVDVKFAAQDAKIDAKFAQVDAKFAAQDAKIDAKFAAQDAQMDARFGRLEDAVGEINVKLAALIAHLDRTEQVEAAVEGRIEDTAGPQGAVG